MNCAYRFNSEKDNLVFIIEGFFLLPQNTAAFTFASRSIFLAVNVIGKSGPMLYGTAVYSTPQMMTFG